MSIAPARRSSQVMFGSRRERVAHPRAVAPLVRLRARRPDRRAAAAVEQLELDARRVDRAAHQAAERVDLADQVALAVPPIAGLQGISATVSGDSVQRPTRHPSRAAAHAASQPAWPAPITTTSKSSRCSLAHASFADAEPAEDVDEQIVGRAPAGDLLRARAARRPRSASTSSSVAPAASACVGARRRAASASSTSARCRTFEIAGVSRKLVASVSAATIVARSSIEPVAGQRRNVDRLARAGTELRRAPRHAADRSC